MKSFDMLRGETPVKADVLTSRGAPRLHLNGIERFPLLAWSWKLVENTRLFAAAGIDLLHPIIGLNAAWPEPGRYDFSIFDDYFDALLEQNPKAFFLPRILLDVPHWWKVNHPEEMIECALPLEPEDTRQYRQLCLNTEGGWLWGIQMEEPSLFSEIWKKDMFRLYRAFIRHIEDSPLCSRIFGYQIGTGIYGEWHYWLAEFIPDYSRPARKKMGPIPSLEERLNTGLGLLRDPGQERGVIDYYRKFHDHCASLLIDLANISKHETGGRIICGAFYGYQLENVWMQEGGHLSPERILNCPDIDFLAGPYTYQTTNIEGFPWWAHDVQDEAGNRLGRSRGVGGDAGYRVLLESVKRHGKLYFAEMDPGTYLEPPPAGQEANGLTEIQLEQCMVGGEGSSSLKGTRNVLLRDLGRMFVSGAGGWLFDFGPVMAANRSWYDDVPIIEAVREITDFQTIRPRLDLSSCARIAAVYDAESLFATRHWKAESPFSFGGHNMDFFSRWFLDSQARSFHRIGAPVDFLYRFDLNGSDRIRYRLLFMVNLFYLKREDVEYLRENLSGSGIWVVWYYAPGFLNPQGAELSQMEALTGMCFNMIHEPGPMKIHLVDFGEDIPLMEFGVGSLRFPRFSVNDSQAEAWGVWTDGSGVSMAVKDVDGWTSVFTGSAPLPVEILRLLAEKSGAGLWSTQPDIVVASTDAAMVVAASDGIRIIDLPKAMRLWPGRTRKKSYRLDLEFGDVCIMTADSERDSESV